MANKLVLRPSEPDLYLKMLTDPLAHVRMAGIESMSIVLRQNPNKASGFFRALIPSLSDESHVNRGIALELMARCDGSGTIRYAIALMGDDKYIYVRSTAVHVLRDNFCQELLPYLRKRAIDEPDTNVFRSICSTLEENHVSPDEIDSYYRGRGLTPPTYVGVADNKEADDVMPPWEF